MNLINCMCAFVWLCRVFFNSVVRYVPTWFHAFESVGIWIERCAGRPRQQQWQHHRHTIAVDTKQSTTIDLYSLNVDFSPHTIFAHSNPFTHAQQIHIVAVALLSLSLSLCVYFFASIRGSSSFRTSSFLTHLLSLRVSLWLIQIHSLSIALNLYRNYSKNKCQCYR